MFKVPDLRNKILFTLFIIAVYRLGAHIPVPGVDFAAVKDLQDPVEQRGVLGFLNLFSGGALTQLRGLRPRDHAVHHRSIIMQLLGGGDPQARAVAGAGRGRAEEDHAVDPLPHGRPGAPAVHRPRVP